MARGPFIFLLSPFSVPLMDGTAGPHLTAAASYHAAPYDKSITVLCFLGYKKGASVYRTKANDSKRRKRIESPVRRVFFFHDCLVFTTSHANADGSHQLRFCGSRSSGAGSSSQPTCCTEAMENRLNDASRQQYELVVRDASSSLSSTFTARAKKFDVESQMEASFAL
ncbi:hypothetical protein OUZ56_002362 [Daphnia magna]|uniref:Secreted protein n=1 Tax=Daphnia magna TaxID=35525 RepID=A0ABR0A5W4_9CRUS|nr:hypothetical protein OUZ56_002362 [Daphnia magna]